MRTKNPAGRSSWIISAISLLYYVMRYPHKNNVIKVSFTGSIAYNFREYLREVAESMEIDIEKIVQHPMEGLIQYHCVTVGAGRE